MSKILVLLSLFNFSLSGSYGQEYAQGIIYSAEVKINEESKYEIFSETGQKILNNKVDWAYSNAWDWLFVVNTKNKLKDVFNIKGIKFPIDSIESTKSVYTNLNRIALKKNGKWGFYDKSGSIKIKHTYSEVSNFKDDIAAVKINDEIFFIDTNGIKVHNPYNASEYNFSDFDIDLGMYGFSSPNYTLIEKGSKKGLSDAKGKVLIPAEYDEILSLKEHFKQVTVKKDGKYGVVSFEGKVLIPIIYEKIIVLNDYLAQ